MPKQKKVGMFLFLVLAIGALFFLNTHEVTGAAKQAVTASKVKNAPTGIDDPAWQKAGSVDIPFEGKEKLSARAIEKMNLSMIKAKYEMLDTMILMDEAIYYTKEINTPSG